MDVWPPQESRKRNFAAMSAGPTLSPSPVTFGDRSNSILNTPHYIPISNDNSQASNRASPFYERRRTSHPHNQPLQALAEAMSNRRSQPVLRPQALVIDLTDDADERPALPRVRERSHSRRPPQLGRSDAVGFGDFIDLTDDNEPDLVITGVQVRHGPNVPPRIASPGLFVAEHAQPPNRGRPWERRGGAGEPQRQLPPPRAMGAAMLNAAHDFIMNHHFIHHFNGGAGVAVIAQPMPQLDYEAAAFAPPRRPEYVAPPEPQKGFTRSPLERDVIICPSCEEELVHHKDEESSEPVMKKNGKAPSRKEREEHPFWVLKDCGHVYCNHCFQNRASANKGTATVTFPERTKPSNGKRKGATYLSCAVDGCETTVGNKEKWVGVFL